MSFADIRQTIVGIWEFLWPSALAMMSAYVVISWMKPPFVDVPSKLLKRLSARSSDVKKLRDVLEPWGLKKLVPIVCVFAFLLVLYVVNLVAVTWSTYLPPRLAWMPDAHVCPGLTKSDSLLLYRAYPTSGSVQDAYSLAVQGLLPEDQARVYDGAASYEMIQSLVKLSVLVGFICVAGSLVRRRRFRGALWRYGVVLLIASVLWTVALAGLIYEKEQFFWRQWYVAKITLLASTPVRSGEAVMPDQAWIEQSASERKYSGGQFWSLLIGYQ